MSYTPRLKTKYREEIVSKLNEQFSYKSIMQVPRLERYASTKVLVELLKIKNWLTMH